MAKYRVLLTSMAFNREPLGFDDTCSRAVRANAKGRKKEFSARHAIELLDMAKRQVGYSSHYQFGLERVE